MGIPRSAPSHFSAQPLFSPQAYVTTHPSPITTCIRILKIVELVGFFVCWFLIDKENKKDAFTLKYVNYGLVDFLACQDFG